ncbi:hypothetical protein AB0J14_16635 [Micromonospora arborensis]|uniref:hypothetical protein n=1 Tax=Micromonospora arborensis TaxID=2116518 RepID=UPI0034072BD7
MLNQWRRCTGSVAKREVDVQETTLSNYRDMMRSFVVSHIGARQLYARDKRVIHELYKKRRYCPSWPGAVERRGIRSCPSPPDRPWVMTSAAAVGEIGYPQQQPAGLAINERWTGIRSGPVGGC